MNYIEYMSDGGTTDSTYYKEDPLEEKWGPKSTLTLKRNNWIKAIRDAVLQAKMLMLKLIQWLPLVLNLIMQLTYIMAIINGGFIPIRLSQPLIVLLILFCPILWVISRALKYCIWHRLYIYLLLLFLITIPIWFCDVVFIVHGALLLILISLCVYFKKGLC